jgi:hypothetical protein
MESQEKLLQVDWNGKDILIASTHNYSSTYPDFSPPNYELFRVLQKY